MSTPTTQPLQATTRRRQLPLYVLIASLPFSDFLQAGIVAFNAAPVMGDRHERRLTGNLAYAIGLPGSGHCPPAATAAYGNISISSESRYWPATAFWKFNCQVFRTGQLPGTPKRTSSVPARKA